MTTTLDIDPADAIPMKPYDRHEIVHVFADAWGDQPALLAEGIAVWTSGAWQDQPVKAAAKKILQEKKWIPLGEIFGTADFRRHPDILTYGISGADCTLDASGSHLWTTAPSTSLDWAWYLVVGNDGSTTEGGWGTDSAADQRSTVASGECGTVTLDAAACIP